MAQRTGDDPNVIFGGSSAVEGNAIVGDNSAAIFASDDDGTAKQDFLDPASAIYSSDSGGGPSDSSAGTGGDTATRRARRDKGQKRGPRASVPNYLGGFEGLILAVHSGLSAVMHTPEFELDETEAKKLANATDELARFYNVAPSAEVKVWMNFVGAAGAVYAPRFVAIAARKKRERAEAAKPKPSPTVVRPDFGSVFPPGGNG